MSHPFLNKKIFPFYSAAWLFPTVLQVWAMSLNGQFSLETSILLSLISNGVFFVLGLSMWFFVKYTLINTTSLFKRILDFTASCIMILFIWQAAIYFLIGLLWEGAPSFTAYFPQRLIYGFMIFLLILMAYYLRISYDVLQEKAQNEIRLREMLKDSELDMLKSQINPHFLFNSLNSVNWLTQIEPEKASEMIVSLSEYLRYSIAGGHRSLSSLKMEMENITRYINIEKIRFGEKLKAEYQVAEECLQVKIPSMILQPLYENAIKHGVYESTDPVWIATKISCNDTHVRIVIQNSYEPNTPYQKGNGLGLNNVRQRLFLIYGESASLETEKKEQLFTATLLIPRICPSEH
jgi:Putative regulator of cell autolysis